MSRFLSYSAGSLSRDPYGFREINEHDCPEKLTQILSIFPELSTILGDFKNTLLINAYPATLGGLGNVSAVDTYLHPPTFVRATTLAAIEQRTVLCAAQPLMGAEMLSQAVAQCESFPRRIVWTTGGYPLPQSLQRAVRGWLASRGCELVVLHCYGIAQLDHTLMAAMDRDQHGRLIYHRVHPGLRIRVAVGSDRVETLGLKTKQMQCEDQIIRVGRTYRIAGDQDRYNKSDLAWLETWSDDNWAQLTGYVGWTHRGRQLQRRAVVDGRTGTESVFDQTNQTDQAGRHTHSDSDIIPIHAIPIRADASHGKRLVSNRDEPSRRIAFHTFAGRFGMSWQQKPTWKSSISKRSVAFQRSSDAA